MKIRNKPAFSLIFTAAALLLASCGEDNGVGGSNGNGGGPDIPPAASWGGFEEYDCNRYSVDDTLNRDADDLGLSYAIVVKYSETGAPVVSGIDEEAVSIDGGRVIIDLTDFRVPFNIIVSGKTADGSLRLRGPRRIGGIYLNGANITNPRGSAINNQINEKTPVHLVSGCGRENYLADGAPYDPPLLGADGVAEDEKGTFFSRGTLAFSGSGYLEVRSIAQHAIVTNESVNIDNVSITVRKAGKDGIHVNEDIKITGGTVQVESAGDAIQSERPGYAIRVSGAKVRARTTGDKSHGMAGEDSVVIEGAADVRLYTSGKGSKGVRARAFMAMSGGTLDITVTGERAIDGSDTSTAAGIRVGNDGDAVYSSDGDMELSGGTLKVHAASNTAFNARGLNIDGNMTVTGGNAVIYSNNDAIRTRGNFTMTGGTVTAQSTLGQDIDCVEFNHSDGTLNAPNVRIRGVQ